MMPNHAYAEAQPLRSVSGGLSQMEKTADSMSGDSTANDESTSMAQSMSASNDAPRDLRKQPIRRNWRIKYNTLAWIVIIVTTALTALDRFTWNLWPLWVNSPGPLRDHWSVSSFISFSWFSGRVLIVSTNVAFITQCRVFWNWFAENAPKWIDCGDIHQVNNIIHYHNSWLLIGVVTVIHCWSIFLPWVAGIKLLVFTSWWRPNDPLTGKRMNFYANRTVSLSMNDVYRLVAQSIAFFLLFPLSRYGLGKKWTLSMFIHLVAAAIFTIDLIRMPSHPHCWVFNCPIILWWMLDRLYGIWYYRRNAPYIVQRMELGDYLVLFLRSGHGIKRELGDVYYLNSLETHSYHRAHPFTTFSNHTGTLETCRVSLATNRRDPSHKFRMMSISQAGDIFDRELIRKDTVDDLSLHAGDVEMSVTALFEQQENPRNIPTSSWDTAAIMKIHGDDSWTRKIADGDDEMLHTLRMWGPYRSEYRELPDAIADGIPHVLIATGAGACYLIDFQQWVLANDIELKAPVDIYYSSRDVGLFQFVSDVLNVGNGIPNLRMNIHFTSNPNVKYDPQHEKALDARIGRSSFEEILRECLPNTIVYFCGAPEMQAQVVKLCQQRGLSARLGHSFH